MDQKTPNGLRLRLGGAPRCAQPTRARLGLLARPGGLCPPRDTPGAARANYVPFGPKKSPWSFIAFGLCLY